VTDGVEIMVQGNLIPFDRLIVRLHKASLSLHIASNEKLTLKNYPRIFFETLRRIKKDNYGKSPETQFAI
jgi:hypothetical protein